MMGFTNRVQAYCRFAIIIIATTAAHSRIQRFTVLFSFSREVLSSNFVQAYNARVPGMGTPRRSPSSTTAPAILVIHRKLEALLVIGGKELPGQRVTVQAWHFPRANTPYGGDNELNFYQDRIG